MCCSAQSSASALSAATQSARHGELEAAHVRVEGGRKHADVGREASEDLLLDPASGGIGTGSTLLERAGIPLDLSDTKIVVRFDGGAGAGEVGDTPSDLKDLVGG